MPNVKLKRIINDFICDLVIVFEIAFDKYISIIYIYCIMATVSGKLGKLMIDSAGGMYNNSTARVNDIKNSNIYKQKKPANLVEDMENNQTFRYIVFWYNYMHPSLYGTTTAMKIFNLWKTNNDLWFIVDNEQFQFKTATTYRANAAEVKMCDLFLCINGTLYFDTRNGFIEFFESTDKNINFTYGVPPLIETPDLASNNPITSDIDTPAGNNAPAPGNNTPVPDNNAPVPGGLFNRMAIGARIVATGAARGARSVASGVGSLASGAATAGIASMTNGGKTKRNKRPNNKTKKQLKKTNRKQHSKQRRSQKSKK